MIEYIIGPELPWFVLCLVARIVRPDTGPLPEPVNRRMEIMTLILPLGAILLSFLFPIIGKLDGWMLLRLAIADSVGLIVLTTTIASAIDYGDSRNSGVGSLAFMVYGLGLAMVFLGVGAAALVLLLR